KPAGWILAPESWERTSRNLHLALISGIKGGDFCARSRNLKFLRFVQTLSQRESGYASGRRDCQERESHHRQLFGQPTIARWTWRPIRRFWPNISTGSRTWTRSPGPRARGLEFCVVDTGDRP